MENFDTQILRYAEDEELLSQVFCGDAELLFLDAVLQSVLRAEA